MSLAQPARPRLDQRGVAAIEFALVVPVFLVLVFGTIEAGRLMWYQVSMQRAVAVAARCGALGTTGCTTDPAIRSKALASTAGAGLGTGSVTVSRPACGVRVLATRQFAFALRIPGISPITLTAQSCHPVVK